MAYKSVPAKGSISSLISEGYGELEELGSECDEAANNFPNSSHPKAEAFSEAASTLQGVSEPDVPDILGENDSEVDYTQLVNKDKRKGMARHARCSNACTKLTSAADAIRALVEELNGHKDEAETKKETLEGRTEQEASQEEVDGEEDSVESLETKISELKSQVSDLEELADQLENDAGDCEGVEFPGLYG